MQTSLVLPLLVMAWLGAPETVSSEDVTVTLNLDGKLVNVSLPEDVVPALGTFLDQIIAITQPNTSYAILACESPDLIDCPENSRCIELANNSANFECYCEPGLIYHENECIEDPCYVNGSSLCETATEICNVTTSKCECAAGFTLIDGICGLNTPCFEHNCPVHAMCVEVNETSFTCHCNGNGGYEKTGGDDDHTIVCTDVDECMNGMAKCSQDAACQNTEGSYSCACDAGFIGNGVTCDDVDECEAGDDDCNINAKCTNTRGSYNCTCLVGYTGNGEDCADIDECADNNGGCHEQAVCENTEGSFSCSCKSGFEGDGQSCTDIDECGADVCEAGKICVNMIGSYYCGIVTGIVINSDDTSSVDTTALENVVVGTGGRRRRKRNADLVDALKQYFTDVLSTNVEFVITQTVPLTLALDADPSFLESIQYQLANLPGKSFGGVTINSITYPTDVYFFGKVDLLGPGVTEVEACNEISEHIKSETPDVTVICDGTFNGEEFNFNVTVTGANSDYDVESVLSTFREDVTQDLTCVCDDEKTDCTILNGRSICNCNQFYHDANFAMPGTQCVNPIASVACGENEIGASLYANYFHRIGLNPESLHLLDTSCSGTVDGDMLIFNSSATDCGTIANHTGDNVEYANKVTNMIFPDGIKKANPSIDFDITCSYPKNFSTDPDVQEPSLFKVVETTVITQNAQGTGQLSLTATIYLDEEFSEALTVNDTVTPGDKLYILATHSATSSPNYLKLSSCHATPTKGSNDLPQRQLISQSCPDELLVSNLKSGLHEYASFELTAINFPDHATLYLHCDVELCNERCSESCVARKRRRRRETDVATQLSLGPLSMSLEAPPDNPEPSSAAASSASAGTVVGVVVGCFAAVAVVAFIVVRRKKSSRNSSKYADTNVPSVSYYNSGFSSQTAEYADCPSRISRRN